MSLVIVPHSAYVELGNIGKSPVYPSVCQAVHLSVHSHTFLHNGWMDWYHDQVPWVTDACKIEFSSVPNLSNCGHFLINVECFVVISERRMWWILFMLGTVISHHSALGT